MTAPSTDFATRKAAFVFIQIFCIQRIIVARQRQYGGDDKMALTTGGYGNIPISSCQDWIEKAKSIWERFTSHRKTLKFSKLPFHDDKQILFQRGT